MTISQDHSDLVEYREIEQEIASALGRLCGLYKQRAEHVVEVRREINEGSGAHAIEDLATKVYDALAYNGERIQVIEQRLEQKLERMTELAGDPLSLGRMFQ